MYNTVKIKEDLIYLGASDRRITLFENIYPLENGVSYNSYLVLDEKTVLLDTADSSVSGLFLSNLTHALSGRTLDYVIVNHMEPDHSASLASVLEKYPAAKVVGNKKTLKLIERFFDFDITDRFTEVSENDTLNTGKHTFTFYMAPMVHWPETMVTYDNTDKTLFSADAFGSFGAINGNIFADSVDFSNEYLPEARRYYTNIVGKYGAQTQKLLEKASALDIRMICPLHGLIWRENLSSIIKKYELWSSYSPETDGVLIVYGSVYGNTALACDILASRLAEAGVKNIKVTDASKTDKSYILADIFKFSHIIFACATYNSGIFTPMDELLEDVCAHGLKNRTVGFIENGSWAAQTAKLMKRKLEALQNITFLNSSASIASSVKENSLPQLDALKDEILLSLKKEQPEKNTMFNLTYGLFVLSAKQDGLDNGCIINTATQISDNPKTLSISVNKSNLTCEMINNTGEFNLSILSKSAAFDTFKLFGFVSGREENKWEKRQDKKRSANGLYYLTDETNGFISAKVINKIDCGTHMLFIAEVTELKALSYEKSLTYEYYASNIKPSAKKEEGKKGWVCRVCGYVYEGETLPDDFICPLCKHGKEDFEPIK